MGEITIRQRHLTTANRAFAGVDEILESHKYAVSRPESQNGNPVWSKISNALKRLGFRSRNFLAQVVSEPQEHVQSGSTIKFREALECFGRACSPMSAEQ
jgi:hypothetical protein